MSVEEAASTANSEAGIAADVGTTESDENLVNIVVPVEWGDLSRDTFLWYVENVHRKTHYVHICHVPDFRRHIQPGMSPQAVMEIMIETNAVSEQLKKLYESLLNEKNIKGKFMRVAGNNRWIAIVEYCKRVDATLLVLGTQPKPGPFQEEPQQRKQSSSSGGSEYQGTAEGSQQGGGVRFSSELSLVNVGPALGTVTDDVLQHCDIPALVYRQPLAPKKRGSVPRRSATKK